MFLEERQELLEKQEELRFLGGDEDGKRKKSPKRMGKRSSLDQKKQRAFSNDGSRESGFEFSSKEKRRTESAGNPNGQLLAKSVLSRYASLLVIAAGLVGLISFLMMYMRPTFKS